MISTFTCGTIGLPEAGLTTGGRYSLASGFWAGRETVVGVDLGGRGGNDLPLSFRLHEAAPNPVLQRTVVAFDLPQPRFARVALYDAAGRLVRTIAEGPFEAGQHKRVWDGTDQAGHRVAPGIYLVRFDAGTVQTRQTIVVIR